MAFSFESEFVFIGKGDESFLENYSYELSDDPASRGGRIFMALEILNNQSDAEDIGEAIFANFKQKFYEDAVGDPYERFEAGLKEANLTIETLKEEKVSRFIGNLNVAIGVMVGDNLYISVAGDAEVYLVRKRFTSIVSEGLAEESKKETFINIANGTLEESDCVLFSSSRLLRYITKGELGKIFNSVGSGRVGSALAELQDFVMTEILGRSAVIGVHVGGYEGSSEAAAGEEDSGESWERQSEGIGAGIISKVGAFFGKIPGVGFLSKISLRNKLPFLRKLGSAIPEMLEDLPKKFMKKETPKPRQMSKERILLIIVVLLVILTGGVFWLKTRGNTQRMISEQQAKLNHVQELMNDASTVSQFDKTKAAELLNAGEQEALTVLSSRFLRGEAVKTLDDIQKFRDTMDDVKRISDPAVLADLSTKRGTVSSLGLLAQKDRLYAFEYNALYEIVLDKLQDPATINDLETVILGTDYLDGNSLLFLTRTGKMIEYADARFNFISTQDGIWKKGVDMKTYNNRLYVLDPERNQVWRYTRRRDGYDAAEQYNQNADLKNGVALAIDSSVYVLNADSSITQLYQGQKQDYPLRKAPLNPVALPTKIYTNPDTNYLFILEPGKSRVVLFRKDPKNGGAQYQTQYVFDKVGTLRDLVVADNRLYVTDDKKVYFVNLSGL